MLSKICIFSQFYDAKVLNLSQFWWKCWQFLLQIRLTGYFGQGCISPAVWRLFYAKDDFYNNDVRISCWLWSRRSCLRFRRYLWWHSRWLWWKRRLKSLIVAGLKCIPPPLKHAIRDLNSTAIIIVIRIMIMFPRLKSLSELE